MSDNQRYYPQDADKFTVSDSNEPTDQDMPNQTRTEVKAEISEYIRLVFRKVEDFLEKYKDVYDDQAIEQISLHLDHLACIQSAESPLAIAEKISTVVDDIKIKISKINADIVQLLNEIRTIEPKTDTEKELFRSLHDRLMNDCGKTMGMFNPTVEKSEIESINKDYIRDLFIQLRDFYLLYYIAFFENLKQMIQHSQEIITENSGDVAYSRLDQEQEGCVDKSYRHTNFYLLVDKQRQESPDYSDLAVEFARDEVENDPTLLTDWERKIMSTDIGKLFD